MEEKMINFVLENYFSSENKTQQILQAKIYAEGTQGKVLTFDGDFCWKIVVGIESDGKMRLLTNLSGIMEVNK